MIEQKKIVVFGGGRWARVLLGVFLKNTESSTVYVVHTKHFVAEMRLWANKKGFGNRVFISDAEVDFQSVKYMAAVVANAAPEHKMTASKAIAAKVPVLIEKPMTPSYADTADLFVEAALNNTLLLGSWVFLYASYLDNFIKYVENIEDIQELYFNWTDEIAESRYGEVKSFDVATPIFKDILPHIMSILSKILNSQVYEFRSCNVSRGGCCLEVKVVISDVTCFLKLERNSSSRQRQIQLLGKRDVQLNFSIEPGVIYNDGEIINADSCWDLSPSPLEKMVKVFLSEVGSTEINQGWESHLALPVSKLIDQIETAYDISLGRWLIKNLNQKTISMEDMHYFVSELVRGVKKVPHYISDETIMLYIAVIYGEGFLNTFDNAKKGGLENDLLKFIRNLDIVV